MLRLQQCSIVLCAALSLLAWAGCSSDSLRSGHDGAIPDDSAVADPAACGCQLTNGVLTMSFACYCQRYDCTQAKPPCYPDGQWSRGCGLDEFSENTFSGVEDSAYDQSGQLVGVVRNSDDSGWVCPSDPSLFSGSMRAGQLLDTCESAVVTCQCAADGGSSCASADAGILLF